MRVEVVVPQIGEAVSELLLTQWIKYAGDAVRTGEVLFEIDSDKAIVEVEAFVDGTLTQIVHGDGASVMPLQVVGYIETEAIVPEMPVNTPPSTLAQPNLDTKSNPAKASPVAERMAAEHGIDLASVMGTGPSGRITIEDVRQHTARLQIAPAPPHKRVLASPKARLMARQHNLDLTSLLGTGSDGMIIMRDIEQHAVGAQIPPPELLSVTDQSMLPRSRQVIAQRMIASKQQVPHFYLMADVNMMQVQALRKYCVDTLHWEKAPTYTDMVVRACALVLRAQPRVNRSYLDGIVVEHASVNIGVAVSTDDGLVVPTLVDVDDMSLATVSRGVRDAAARAREKRLRPSDLTSKSLTISNLGMYRVDAFIAIIDMPDPIILAVGRVADRIVAVDRQVSIQPMCTLTLSVDHRMLDGAIAARYLEGVVDVLEAPFSLLGDL